MASTLFSPLNLGPAALSSRIVMAPMTRSRAAQPGDVPTELMATYYGQRATAGLIITEATQISRQGQGYSFTPGIYTDEQVAGWKKVTQSVHMKGGKIFLQLWHVGRMSHESFHKDGQPVAPSALNADAKVWVVDPATGQGNMVDTTTPRALNLSEIDDILEDYRGAARRAMEAGFDGVEIHGGNGYLIDEFLRRSSNKRTDKYGGVQENRIRFAVDVAEAVANEIGADRTGIRLAPYITQRNMNDEETIEVILKAAKEFQRIGLVYIHLSEADWDDAPIVPDDFRHELRAAYDGAIIVAGKYTQHRAQDIIQSGLVDLVAFGRPYVANPDLVRRYAENLPLAELDPLTLFGGDAQGYTSYPAYA